MMLHKPHLVGTLLLAFAGISSVLHAEVLFTDPFSEGEKVPERRALRGDWQIADGVAKCTQDDVLYKKYKDHGPIIFYDVPSTNATYRYAFRPAGCKTVVFTLNGADGHVFRIVTSERGANFRAFPPNGEKKSIAALVVPEWKLEDEKWTEVEVTLEGGVAAVRFGENDPVKVEHESFARAKTNLSVGFAFGSLEVKGVSVAK